MRTGSGQTGSQAGGSTMMTPSALADSGDATNDTMKANTIRDRIGIRRMAVSSPGQPTLAAACVGDAARLLQVPRRMKSLQVLRTEYFERGTHGVSSRGMRNLVMAHTDATTRDPSCLGMTRDFLDASSDRIASNRVREFLGDGDDGEMDVGVGTGREDRGIDHAQTINPKDVRVVVDDSHRIRGGTHAASARRMECRAEARQGPRWELAGISPGRRLFGVWLEDALHWL